MHMIQAQLSNPQVIQQLSKQIGVQDHEKTAAAANGIASVLTGALAKNASTNEGAMALAGALDRDHDGSILDDIGGFLSGATQGGSGRAANGAGILGHLLGGKQSGAIDMISKMSGLDQGKVTQLMVSLAPMIMGMLGKAKQQNGLDLSGLIGMLSGAFSQQKAQSKTNPAAGMIASFIDKDGDGDMSDELLDMGKNLLGGLFKKR